MYPKTLPLLRMRPELESHLLKSRWFKVVGVREENPMIYSGFGSVGSKIVSLSAFLFGPWNAVNWLLSFLFHLCFFFFVVCLLVLFVFASIKQLTIVFFCFYTFNCCLNWFCVVVFLFFLRQLPVADSVENQLGDISYSHLASLSANVWPSLSSANPQTS